jgi:high-affinity nickel-transport protein
VATEIAQPKVARKDLTRAEWRRLGGMGLVILALNVGGWGVFAFAVVPHHFQFRGLGLGLGVALTAWTLGPGTLSTQITSRRSTTPPAS